MNGPGDVRVLVVDDDAMVGEMIQAMLAHAGFRSIGRAASGRAAVEMAAQTHPDVVLMDISLPDMDGIEAAQRIADSAPVPVVILSAYDTPDLLERAARAGVGAYLVKPADAREMERAIAVARARFDDISALRNLNRALEGEIRERQQAQRELQASEERFRTAIDFTYNWEYWLAPDGHFVYVSPACERITGYTREEFEADPGLLAQITLPEDRAKAEMRRAADGTAAEVQEAQFRIVTRWGEVRTIEQVSLPVFGAAGDLRGWRASNRDVTERLALEERLREARRVEAVGQLAGGLAHDLNNLLTVVRGYAELAREQAGNSDGLREDLDEILRAGDRAAGI
ncbi:MAG: response regulator, partial [Chloroflexi bacterium]|nr:response regulator [Chloroflexota bacterium]